MKPSKTIAEAHFKNVVMPRRIRDRAAEKQFFEKTDKQARIYRKVLPDEEDRAEEYPVLKAGLKTFAHFGIGIGIYFSQLVILTVIFFISGIIMVPAISAYRNGNYRQQSNENFLLDIGAACDGDDAVIATIGCPDGEATCAATLRSHCNLPINAALADLTMCVFIVVALFIARLLENGIEEQLDEAMQTAQDYSVVVEDPEPDTDNPDEWYNYFSKFGVVRYITIARRNKNLCAMIIKKHKITRKLKEMAAGAAEGQQMGSAQERVLKRYERVNHELQKYFMKSYHVCKVYVTFETEEGQRNCLRELEVPDLYALLDLQSDYTDPRFLFRGTNVLNVGEPPEPDSILWENVEAHPRTRNMLTVLMYAITVLVLVGLYFLLVELKGISQYLFAFLIGVIDAMLPTVFFYLTEMSEPQSEGMRLNTLQLQLFGARLLLSTIFPFIQTYREGWDTFLDRDVIFQAIIVQLSTCFVSPLINLSDISEVIKRNVFAPLIADTQAEMNSMFSGSYWSLAERYTVIAKIIFVSLFYVLLSPLSLLIAMIAFAAVFFIDRFLLLRRWQPTALIDATIASRLRQQAVLAVAAHMFVSMMFIYSWPMDSAYVNMVTGAVEYVVKEPFISDVIGSNKPWHTPDQARALRMYRAGFFIIGSITAILWVLIPLAKTAHRLFCRQLNIVGDSQGINFSAVPKILSYVPITTTNEGEKFIISYTSDMLAKNKPSLIRSSPDERDDLSYYVPSQLQPKVLSIVKYYGDKTISDATLAALEGSGANGRGEEKDTGTKYRIVSTKDGMLQKIPHGLPGDIEKQLTRGKSFFERDSATAAAAVDNESKEAFETGSWAAGRGANSAHPSALKISNSGAPLPLGAASAGASLAAVPQSKAARRVKNHRKAQQTIAPLPPLDTALSVGKRPSALPGIPSAGGRVGGNRNTAKVSPRVASAGPGSPRNVPPGRLILKPVRQHSIPVMNSSQRATTGAAVETGSGVDSGNNDATAVSKTKSDELV